MGSVLIYKMILGLFQTAMSQEGQGGRHEKIKIKIIFQVANFFLQKSIQLLVLNTTQSLKMNP